MQILVLSDSHGILKNFVEVLKKYQGKIEYIIHLGDYDRDINEVIPFFTNYKFINISGNCDFRSVLPSEKIFSLYNKNFFVTHGHRYNVKSNLIKLSYSAEEKNADICLFGHTHIPELTIINNIIYMNPGSITMPRCQFKSSYGIIDIEENGNITAEILDITDKVIKTI